MVYYSKFCQISRIYLLKAKKMDRAFVEKFRKVFNEEYNSHLSYAEAFEKFIELTNLIKLLLPDTGGAKGGGNGKEKRLQVKVQN